MKAVVSAKKSSRFQFVLDELAALRPAVRQMFAFTCVYLDEKLLLSLRDSAKQPQHNGVWLYTEREHIDSLRREFAQLPRRYFWKSARSGSGWVILAARLDEFEEYASRACELILCGDRRIGRVTRRSTTGRKREAVGGAHAPGRRRRQAPA